MSYATRNENGDNMGNTFVRCPTECTKEEFAKRWDAIFGPKQDDSDWRAARGVLAEPILPEDDYQGLIRKVWDGSAS